MLQQRKDVAAGVVRSPNTTSRQRRGCKHCFFAALTPTRAGCLVLRARPPSTESSHVHPTQRSHSHSPSWLQTQSTSGTRTRCCSGLALPQLSSLWGSPTTHRLALGNKSCSKFPVVCHRCNQSTTSTLASTARLESTRAPRKVATR